MNNIFIAFIFLSFNFYINLGDSVIGIIPSCVGYWFLGKGLVDLQSKSATLTKMISWAKGMMILSAITWVMAVLPINFGLIGGALGIVEMLLNLYVTYEVVVGIKEVEEYHQTMIHADELKKAWLVANIGGIICTVLALIPLIGLVFAIGAIALSVYFVVVMNKVKEAYIAIPPATTFDTQTENTNTESEI